MIDTSKKIKVLVIAGGGVYGIIPCSFLNLLSNEQISKVDVFGGTSAGGILSLHLALNKDTNQLYRDFKGNVKNFFIRNIFNIINPFSPKYDEKGIESSLKKILPQKVSSCQRKFVVPSFNFKNISPIIFHNFQNYYSHMELWKIARATSAAPTFFVPYSQNILIDGGILQNLPIITTASIICKFLNKKPSDLDVFAIGTGYVDKDMKKTLNQVKKFSKIQWAKYLMSIILTDGNEMMSKLWGENMGFNSFRMFNPVVIDGKMDNIDNINLIEEKCEIYYGQFLQQWEKFIEF